MPRRFGSSARPCARRMPGARRPKPDSTRSSHVQLPATRFGGPLRAVRRKLRGRDPRPRARRLEAKLCRGPARPGVHGRVPVGAEALRRSTEPHLPRRAHESRTRRRADLSEARGPEPHRRPQGQQHDRPGDAGAADGQAAGHRGDGCRPAWRGHRDHLRALRPRVRRLHGQRGRQAAVAERLPHEPARRDGRAGRERLEDIEGRAQRGAARLGHERREHVLHHRHGRRTASVSDDGARLPARDRRRVHRADARDDRTPARRGDRLRRWRQQCDGHLLSVHRSPGNAPDRRRSGRAGARDRPPCGLAVGRIARRAARQPDLPAAGCERPDPRDPFDLGRARLSGRRPGACAPEGHRSRRVRRHHRRRGAGGVPSPLPHRGHHSGARVEPCGRPCDEDRADDAVRPASAGQSVGSRRQGHRHGGRSVRRRVLLPAVVYRTKRQGLDRRESRGARHEPDRRHVRSAARSAVARR